MTVSESILAIGITGLSAAIKNILSYRPINATMHPAVPTAWMFPEHDCDDNGGEKACDTDSEE